MPIPEVLSCYGYVGYYDQQLRNKVKLLFENLKIILIIILIKYSDEIILSVKVFFRPL